MSFEAFWSAYPRRVAKIAARKAYDKALRSATDDEIMRGLQSYSSATSRTEMRYICHPATWLNDGRWDDDYLAIAPQRQRGMDHFAAAIDEEENGHHGQVSSPSYDQGDARWLQYRKH